MHHLGQKKIGFPLNDSVVKRSFVATGGTVLASKLAINFGLACNTQEEVTTLVLMRVLVFVFNDVAVGASITKKGLARKILV